VLFADLRNSEAKNIKIKACMCLAHLANTRHCIFESEQTRINYVCIFTTELMKLFHSQAIHQYVLKERQLFKEFVPILIKLENNFQVKDILKSGQTLLEQYLNELF
jgi:hypothetical protein